MAGIAAAHAFMTLHPHLGDLPDITLRLNSLFHIPASPFSWLAVDNFYEATVHLASIPFLILFLVTIVLHVLLLIAARFP